MLNDLIIKYSSFKYLTTIVPYFFNYTQVGT